MSQGRSASKTARGFTLVELLLAIAVMSLLAILSWRGLDGMVRAQEITRQRADEMLVLQSSLGQWGTDLDALMPIANTTPLDWDGQVLRLTRRTSAVPDEGALVVAWTLRGAQGATLLPLQDWQIFYYRGGAWSNAQSSSGTTAENSTAAIPDGVRLQITLPPGQALAGQLTRDWVNPLLGGGRT
ncbi:MAG: prepilin-type N-terminal cleavage/methylation domain-containing protein [Acidovorax sp.]|nr:MAG: prepilin-type N-terminal cleavage/methylation domain-containing protein [Acidovorax sp.]